VIRSTSPRVSLCMIVRNEMANLPACLEEMRYLVDEIVVVDTGSTDRTVEVAEALGAKVVVFPWTNDFSAARNESMRHATGDYILWLDADDRLTPAEISKLDTLLRSLDGSRRAYMLTTYSTPALGRAPVIDRHPRLFRNVTGVSWRYRVHEQIIGSLNELSFEVVDADVTIVHEGYSDPVLAREKARRNIRLSRLDYALDPEDPAVLFHLGRECASLGQFGEAYGYLTKTLKVAPPYVCWLPKLYRSIVACLTSLGKIQEAFAVADEALARFDLADIELAILHGELSLRLGHANSALAHLQRVLDYLDHLAANGPQGTAYRGLVRRMVGGLYLGQRRYPEAEKMLKTHLAEQPNDSEAGFLLCYTLFALERWSEFDAMLERVRSIAGSEPIFYCAEALKLHARGQGLEACRRVEEACRVAPSLLLSRTLLADLRLTWGGSLDECREAMAGVLAVCPEHLAARRELERLEQRQRTGEVASTIENRCSSRVTVAAQWQNDS